MTGLTCDDLDFDTPRPCTARVPIFCEVCRKNGSVIYRDGDERKGGTLRGPSMPLLAFANGDPRICARCNRDRKH